MGKGLVLTVFLANLSRGWQTTYGDVCKILFMGLLVDPRVHDAEPLRL